MLALDQQQQIFLEKWLVCQKYPGHHNNPMIAKILFLQKHDKKRKKSHNDFLQQKILLSLYPPNVQQNVQEDAENDTNY
jgi:hypothetical protein